MGLFLCPRCDKQLGAEHVCDPEAIESYIRHLQEQASQASFKLRKISDAVCRLLEPLPPLDTETVEVDSDWLRKLWAIAGRDPSSHGERDEFKTADSFLSRLIAKHQVLSAAFRLFRSNDPSPLVDKLRRLKERCEEAKRVLGYSDSNLELTPEEIIESVKRPYVPIAKEGDDGR